jgi:hypothetical protein
VKMQIYLTKKRGNGDENHRDKDTKEFHRNSPQNFRQHF